MRVDYIFIQTTKWVAHISYEKHFLILNLCCCLVVQKSSRLVVNVQIICLHNINNIPSNKHI